jgi:two-component system, NarL family, response regulator DegU
VLVKRVLVVDEQALFRRGLIKALEGDVRFRVVGEASCAHQALQAVAEVRPHIVVVSDSLPGISGGTLIEHLVAQGRIEAGVLLIEQLSESMLLRARMAGASAVVERAVLPADVALALAHALASRDNRSRRSLVHAAHTQDAPRPHIFSARELEILDCVAHGLSNREIASELYVSEQTVKNHLTSVFKKLNVDDRVQALLYAVRMGWVSFGRKGSTERPRSRSA